MGVEKIPYRIPEQWSAVWFRDFITDVLARLDVRNAIGSGVTISASGNSVATISAATEIAAAISAHVAAADPHPTYLTAAEGDALFLTPAEGAAAYAAIGHTHATLPLSGTGSPESVVTAGIGTLYLRTDGGAGTTLYVKESGTGATGWIAK